MKGFWDRVDTSGECWEWQGARTRDGYGVVSVFGNAERSHRVAYILEYGRIPNGRIICHSCDNPSCVRPAHLFVGTDKDNSDDKKLKGRGVNGIHLGEKNPSSKVTWPIVAAIREEYTTGDITQRLLAEKYGIVQSQVGRIVRGEHWTSAEAD